MERKLEDLNCSPEQLEAIRLAKIQVEIRRVQDEAAAERITRDLPPWVRPPWYRRAWRWVKRRLS